MARTFYRLIQDPVAAPEHFLSHAARGVVPPGPDPERRADGVSVFATFAQARRHSRISPGHGEYIVELDIPDDVDLAVARTGRQAGHHTIWGSPELMLSCVAAVVPVWSSER